MPSPNEANDSNPREYGKRLKYLIQTRVMPAEEGPPVGVDSRVGVSVERAASELAEELDLLVEAIQDAEADTSPCGGYWTVFDRDVEEVFRPAMLATAIFQDLWNPLMTGLRLRGLDGLANQLERLASELIPQARRLSRTMDAVAYLTHGGPEDILYEQYAKEDLVTHQLALEMERRDVIQEAIAISRILRTLSSMAEAPGGVRGAVNAAGLATTPGQGGQGLDAQPISGEGQGQRRKRGRPAKPGYKERCVLHYQQWRDFEAKWEPKERETRSARQAFADSKEMDKEESDAMIRYGTPKGKKSRRKSRG